MSKEQNGNVIPAFPRPIEVLRELEWDALLTGEELEMLRRDEAEAEALLEASFQRTAAREADEARAYSKDLYHDGIPY